MNKFYKQTMRNAIKDFFPNAKPAYYYLFHQDLKEKLPKMREFLYTTILRDPKKNEMDHRSEPIKVDYKEKKNKENFLLSLDDLNDFLEKKIKRIQECVGDETKWTRLQILLVFENIFFCNEKTMSKEEIEILFLIGKNLLPLKSLQETNFLFGTCFDSYKICPSIIRDFINIKYVRFGEQCYEINIFQNEDGGVDMEALTLANIQQKILQEINAFLEKETSQLLKDLKEEQEIEEPEERDPRQEIDANVPIDHESDNIFNIVEDMWEDTKLSIIMYKIFRQNFDYGLGIFYDPWFLSVNKDFLFNNKTFYVIKSTIKTFPCLVKSLLEKYGIEQKELEEFLGGKKQTMEKAAKSIIESIFFEHNRKQKKIIESLEKISLELEKNQNKDQYNKIGYSQENIRKIINELISVWS